MKAKGPQVRNRADVARAGVMLGAVVVWALHTATAYDPVVGVYSAFNPDTYSTLTVARTFAHGHPWRLNPDDPPGTILSDLLSPVYFSLGFWLGFRDTSSFVLWSYLATLPLVLISTWALWRFFSWFTPAVAVPATWACILFPGISSNLFTTNFGLFFATFWSAMASMASPWRFFVLVVLASLFRPEGVLISALLWALFTARAGGRLPRRAWLGLVPVLVPHAIYLHRSGWIMPQGVSPQNLLLYQPLLQALGRAAATATDQIKGALLGMLPTPYRIGTEGSSWIGAFPPLIWACGCVGLFLLQRRWFLIVAFFSLLFVTADALTTFSGVHYNRHLHVFTPFFVGSSLWFIHDVCRGRPRLLWAVVAGGGLLVVLQLLGSLAVCRSMVRTMATDKVIADHVGDACPGCRALDMSARVQYWADGRTPWSTLTPAVDPFLGRYVRRYFQVTEMAEHVQRFAHRPTVFIALPSSDAMQEWLLSFTARRLATFTSGYTQPRQVVVLDLSLLADAPPWPDPLEDLDVGDAVSEHQHSYRHSSSLTTPVGGFLHPGEGFWDGGRPMVRREEFSMELAEGGVLVARYRGLYEGIRLSPPHSRVRLSLTQTPLVVRAGTDTLFSGTVALPEGFSHLSFPTPVRGRKRITVEGEFHSFHYWSYGPEALSHATGEGAPAHLPGSRPLGDVR